MNQEIDLSNTHCIHWRESDLPPVLTSEEERDLIDTYRSTGDLTARDRLITSNLRYVVSVARDYRNLKVDMRDLVQEGVLGLIQSLDKFDPSRGVRLVTCADSWIRAAILLYLQTKCSTVRNVTSKLSRELYYRLKTIPSPDSADYEPTIARIAAEKGCSETRVQESIERLRLSYVSENVLNYRCEESDIEERIESQETRQLLEEAISSLDPREQLIIRARYLDDPPKTFRELGPLLGISFERVRQIESSVLKKLKIHLAKSQ